MKTIKIEVDINAGAERIWQVLWNKDSYKQWAAAMGGGAHYEGEIEEGTVVSFLDGGENGMRCLVKTVEAPERVVFEALQEMHADKSEGNDVIDMKQEYSLQANGEVTRLQLCADVDDAHEGDAEARSREALRRVKELAEKY